MADYNFSVYFVDDSGIPVTDVSATVTVSAFDEDTLEWFDFSLLTFTDTPITRETLATNQGNGVFSYTFDPSTWGNRRVHFSALCEYSDVKRFAERVETFRFGSYVPPTPVIPESYGYVTVEEVRAFGITEDIVPNDADIIRLIKHASLQIDMYCGQWFNLRRLTLPVKYTGGRYIYLPTMLMSLESICYEDSEDIVIPTDRVKIYNRIPIDYEDPRIYLKDIPRLPYPMYPSSLTRDEIVFEITGTWGVVEDENGTILEPIKRACLITIVDLLGYDTSDYDDTSLKQFIVMETTDRHQYTLSSERMKVLYGKATILPMCVRLLLEPFIAPKIL